MDTVGYNSIFNTDIFPQRLCWKISYIILILAFISAISLFKGTADDFAPKHIVAILDIVNQGYLVSNNMVDSAPGYYVYGAEIAYLSGISTSELLFFPIQIIPFIIVTFSTFYYFSKSMLFSSAVVFIQIFMHSNGSMMVFFWPHGIGSILFYAMLLALICSFKNQDRDKLKYVFILIIMGISLNFISYNNAFKVIILLCFIISLIFINLISGNRLRSFSLLGQQYKRYLISLTLIMFTVQLGFSNFIYGQFISALDLAEGSSISIIDKLLVKFGGQETISSPFSDILVSYPRIFLYFSMIRSFFIFSSILIFTFMIIKYHSRNRDFKFQDILCISLLLVSMSMAAVRASIGGGFMPYFYLPAFFCAAWIVASELKYRGFKYKYFSYLFLLALLFISPLSIYEMHANSLFDYDSNNYQEFEQPAMWRAHFMESELSYSDEFTRNMFTLMQTELQVSDEPSVDAVRLLPFNETLFLIKDEPSILTSGYYIINYNKKIMSLQNWRYIKSWTYFSDRLHSNRNLDGIYDSGSISIYSKAGKTF